MVGSGFGVKWEYGRIFVAGSQQGFCVPATKVPRATVMGQTVVSFISKYLKLKLVEKTNLIFFD